VLMVTESPRGEADSYSSRDLVQCHRFNAPGLAWNELKTAYHRCCSYRESDRKPDL